MSTGSILSGEEYWKMESAIRMGNKEIFLDLLSGWIGEDERLAAVCFGLGQSLLFQIGMERNVCGRICLHAPDEFGSIEEAISFLGDMLEGLEEKQVQEKKAVNWAKNYIDCHLGEDISMAEIANHVNLNYSYFSRLFRQAAGSSFSGYVYERRMQAARERLGGGERVKDVAALVGYREVKSFSRAFHRRFGVAPGSYFLSAKK